MNFGFKRKSHLKSKLIIDQLFASGKVITERPFRLVYLEMETPVEKGVQILISVPKKRFKLAVSRNKIRRMTSEIYRLGSVSFQHQIKEENRQIALAIIYIGNRRTDFIKSKEKLEVALQKLATVLK